MANENKIQHDGSISEKQFLELLEIIDNATKTAQAIHDRYMAAIDFLDSLGRLKEFEKYFTDKYLNSVKKDMNKGVNKN